MVNNVYVIYNVLSGRYGDVCAYPTDQFALARLEPVLSRQGSLSEFQLCHIGVIDVESGILTSKPPVRIPWKSVALSPSVPPEPTKEEIEEQKKQAFSFDKRQVLN